MPTFSYSKKQFIECELCNAAFEVPKEMKRELAERIMSEKEIQNLLALLEKEK